jgi:prepilin-type N-terminal cleavage/methylation domain-containing protein
MSAAPGSIRGDEGGFTLIELLVAISIFSIGMLSLAMLQTSSIRHNHSSRQIGTGDQYAIQTIERLLALDWDAPELSRAGNPHSPPTAEPWDDNDLDGGQYAITWNVADRASDPNIPENIKRIDLSVSAGRMTGARSRSYTFLVRPH